MKLSCIQILTVVPKDEIESKAIPYVKSKIEENIKLTLKEKTSMKKFWTYFKKQWMSSPEMISSWNISKDYGKSAYHDLHNRTNNGMERYVFSSLIFSFSN